MPKHTNTKSKSVKRTSAPRAARKPVDPRLKHLIEMLDEIEDFKITNVIHEDCRDIAAEVIDHAVRASSFDRVAKIIAILWERDVWGDGPQGDVDLEERREAMLKIVHDEHRAHCACCRRRDNQPQAVAS